MGIFLHSWSDFYRNFYTRLINPYTKSRFLARVGRGGDTAINLIAIVDKLE
jgi:hypothetical protein